MDFGNLLTPTSSSSKKAPAAKFHPHTVNVTKERSIPPTGDPPRMKPLPNDRLNLDRVVTQGRFSKWQGESSMPATKNNAWWKGEAAGSTGSILEQRRRRMEGGGGGDGGKYGSGSSRSAKKEEAQRMQLLVTKDRFGNEFDKTELKDAIRKGSFEPEKRENTTVSRKTLDDYDKTRLNPAKQIGVRSQYVGDCLDVAHRDWKLRFAVPPQARENDAVARTISKDAFLNSSSSGRNEDGTSNGNNSNGRFVDDDDVGCYRVLPPLKEVERVYHMNGGYSKSGCKRFASPFYKNERSAREGYITNDSAIGRTTPIGERESASKAPPLSCLALATAEVKRRPDQSDDNASHVPSFAQSRSVVIASSSANVLEEAAAMEKSRAKRRAADASVVRLAGVAKQGRVAACTPFSTLPQSVLNMIPSAGA